MSEPPSIHKLYSLLSQVLGMADELKLFHVSAHVAEAIDALSKPAGLLKPGQDHSLDDD